MADQATMNRLVPRISVILLCLLSIAVQASPISYKLGTGRMSSHNDPSRIAAILGDILVYPTKLFGDVTDQRIHIHVGQEAVVR